MISYEFPKFGVNNVIDYRGGHIRNEQVKKD